ncbi:hypothetical protein ACQ4PT_058803 [Festuca glaucescens]
MAEREDDLAGGAGGGNERGKKPAMEEETIEELIGRMKLTAKGSKELFIDDRAGVQEKPMWALAGKILAPGPKVFHIQTIADVLRPAWGNPRGLVFRDGGPNLFVAELPSEQVKERIWERSPWTVNKHAVILENFKRSQRPSELRFDRMPIWIRVMNLPFNLNDDWGKEIAEMVGDFISLDTSNANLVIGKYLRARVAIDVNEPLQRWIEIDSTAREACDWYDIKYENVPYFCFSGGLLGHSDLVCPNPEERDELGRLPFWPSLRVQEERKNRTTPFAWGNTSGGFSSSQEPRDGAGVPPTANQNLHRGGGRGGGRLGPHAGRFNGARGNAAVYHKLALEGTLGTTEPMEVENRLTRFVPQNPGEKRDERPEQTSNSAVTSPDAKKKKVGEGDVEESEVLAPATGQLGQIQ